VYNRNNQESNISPRSVDKDLFALESNPILGKNLFQIKYMVEGRRRINAIQITKGKPCPNIGRLHLMVRTKHTLILISMSRWRRHCILPLTVDPPTYQMNHMGLHLTVY